MGLKVLDYLTYQPFRGSKVIGGWGGLSNEIKSISIFEVPKAISFFSGGEFLLSTGFYIKDHPGWLNNLLVKLDRKKVSALAIKLGPYIEKIPDDIIKKANRLKFPLIIIPESGYNSDSLKSLMEIILKSEGEIKRDNFRTRIVDKIAQEKKLEDVIKQLARETNLTTVLQDENFRVISYYLPEAGIKKDVFKKNEDLRKEKQQKKAPFIYTYKDDKRREEFCELFYPIEFDDFFAYLSLISKNTDILREKLDIVTFYAKIISICHTLFDQHKKIDVYTKINIFKEFLENEELENTNVCFEKALKKTGFLIGVQFNYEADDCEIIDYEKLNSWLNCKDIYSYFAVYNNRLYIIYHMDGNFSRKKVDLFSEKLLGWFKKNNFTVQIAISDQARNREEYKKCKIQIEKLFKYSSFVNSESSADIKFYNDNRILNFIGNNSISTDKLLNNIKPIIEYDKNNRLDLLKTLKIYFQNNCSLTETASSLFIHKNTLIYRLKKVEELTGYNFKNFQDRVVLYISIILNG